MIKPLRAVGSKGEASGRPASVMLQKDFFKNVLNVASRLLFHKGDCTIKDSTRSSRAQAHIGGCGHVYPQLGQINTQNK